MRVLTHSRLHANNCVIVQFRAKAAEMPAVLRMLDRAKIGTEFGNVDVIPIAFTLPGFLHDQRNFEEAQQRDTATAALSAIFKKDGVSTPLSSLSSHLSVPSTPFLPPYSRPCH